MEISENELSFRAAHPPVLWGRAMTYLSIVFLIRFHVHSIFLSRRRSRL
jgi:hypothetical protein